MEDFGGDDRDDHRIDAEQAEDDLESEEAAQDRRSAQVPQPLEEFCPE